MSSNQKFKNVNSINAHKLEAQWHSDVEKTTICTNSHMT